MIVSSLIFLHILWSEISELRAVNRIYRGRRDPGERHSTKDDDNGCKRSRKSLLLCFDGPLREIQSWASATAAECALAEWNPPSREPYSEPAGGVCPKSVLLGGLPTQFTSQAPSTVIKTTAPSEVHAWWCILAGM